MILRYWALLAFSTAFVGWSVGCSTGTLRQHGDDDVFEDDDTDGDDDTVADDDTADDDTADDDTAGDDDTDEEIDDNTCDEGASSATSVSFYVFNTWWQSLGGVEWSITDLDATTGVLDAAPVASGVTGEDGIIDVELDCADGWMMLETVREDYLCLHAYFRVAEAPYWPVVTVGTSITNTTVDWLISSDEAGMLGVYKASTFGSEDFQGDDRFTIDGGEDLVPASASNHTGMWIYDGALGNEMAGIWHVDAELAGGGQVVELSYDDISEGYVTRLKAPIWSWDDGSVANNLTALYVIR